MQFQGMEPAAWGLARLGWGLEPDAKPKPRFSAHYRWAALIARIYELFPLICPENQSPQAISAISAQTGDFRCTGFYGLFEDDFGETVRLMWLKFLAQKISFKRFSLTKEGDERESD